MAAFPEHEWLGWQFRAAPRRWWDNRDNQSKYLQWLGKQLGYTKMEDWYNITYEAISSHSGSCSATFFFFEFI